jgi:hypothetical protein
LYQFKRDEMTYTPKWFYVTGMFGVLPFFTNSYLAYTAYVSTPLLFGRDAEDCIATALVAFGCALAAFLGFAWHGFGPKKTLAAVFGHSIVLIFTFAGIYRGHDLSVVHDKAPECLLREQATSLYFSVVTWTTLGYGDCLPPADIRLVAALEALIGNLLFGTAVGLGTYLLCSTNEEIRIRRAVATEDVKLLTAIEAVLEKHGRI